MAFDLVGKAVKNLTLHTTNYGAAPVKIIPAKTGDSNSRYFVVTLKDDRGVIDLSGYNVASLNATLPDNTTQVSSGEINADDNTIIVKLASSMLTQEGKVICDVTIGGSDETQLTSANFYVIVTTSQISDDAVEGSDAYTALIEALEEIDAAIAAEEARVSAEKARVTEYNSLVTNLTKTLNELETEIADIKEAINALNSNDGITIYYDDDDRVAYDYTE